MERADPFAYRDEPWEPGGVGGGRGDPVAPPSGHYLLLNAGVPASGARVPSTLKGQSFSRIPGFKDSKLNPESSNPNLKPETRNQQPATQDLNPQL
jgi:hypothetical protein